LPRACTTGLIPGLTTAQADPTELSHRRPELAKLPELAGGLAGKISPLPRTDLRRLFKDDTTTTSPHRTKTKPPEPPFEHRAAATSSAAAALCLPVEPPPRTALAQGEHGIDFPSASSPY
jgi:hypothetical protein